MSKSSSSSLGSILSAHVLHHSLLDILCLCNRVEPGVLPPSYTIGIRVEILSEALLPRGNGYFNGMLNRLVYGWVFPRMQIVDIAGNLGLPVLAERDIGRQPLIQARAVFSRDYSVVAPVVDIVSESPPKVWEGSYFGYNSAFADEIQGIVYADLLLVKEPGPSYFLMRLEISGTKRVLINSIP